VVVRAAGDRPRRADRHRRDGLSPADRARRQFLFLASVLAFGAGYIDEGPWFRVFLWVTSATVIASGAQYVTVWGRKAMQARRAATRP
jgi:fatty acid desaturase